MLIPTLCGSGTSVVSIYEAVLEGLKGTFEEYLQRVRCHEIPQTGRTYFDLK